MNLVTGATGHIGNVLVRQLLDRGEKVRALVLPGEDLSALEGLAVERVEGDVTRPETLPLAFEGVERVYHLAGVISIGGEREAGRPSLVERVNVQGTRNILKAAKQFGVRRLVYTSSIHAIQRAPHGVLIDESLPFDPDNCAGSYDRSKALASLEVQKAARDGLDAVLVCPTGVIGPFDYRLSEMGRLILYILRQKVHLWIEGEYDFVDVRDVARGLIQAGEKGHCGQHYILSGEQISLAGLIHKIKALTGLRSLEVKVPLPLARLAARLAPLYSSLVKEATPLLTPYSLATVQSNSVVSHARAQKELGFEARPLSESIADTVAWFRKR